jgi:hypothetical protein
MKLYKEIEAKGTSKSERWWLYISKEEYKEVKIPADINAFLYDDKDIFINLHLLKQEELKEGEFIDYLIDGRKGISVKCYLMTTKEARDIIERIKK